MTPAINLLKKNKLPHKVLQYPHDPAAQSYGLEAAEKLNLPPEQVFKTLVAKTDAEKLVVAIVPVTTQLNMKQLAKAAGAKRAEMAAPEAVMRSTGYVLGGVSPLGQKRRLPTFIDRSAQNYSVIYVSAGKRGLDVEVSVNDLANLLSAKLVAIT